MFAFISFELCAAMVH
ncbi:hypothetical protein B4U80_05284 [Leptotrombidium deliense]|uniref:Uncharacterized protein n=1 Tax=Leptotrombidium deliense TaxID=299467 RepID=A0A443SIZ1_9ACAR|nr:hypothetical protein B4U80_05284 [Leptotrombidium deliense]